MINAPCVDEAMWWTDAARNDSLQSSPADRFQLAWSSHWGILELLLIDESQLRTRDPFVIVVLLLKLVIAESHGRPNVNNRGDALHILASSFGLATCCDLCWILVSSTIIQLLYQGKATRLCNDISTSNEIGVQCKGQPGAQWGYQG